MVKEYLSGNAGVHVYRWRLEACLEGRKWTVNNDADGWIAMSDAFKAFGVRLVAIDVIGGYERGLVQTLQATGLNVARVGMRQALDFARSRDASNKVPRVDASVLRDFADALVSFGPDFDLYLPHRPPSDNSLRRTPRDGRSPRT